MVQSLFADLRQSAPEDDYPQRLVFIQRPVCDSLFKNSIVDRPDRAPHR
jgi:hypothetical protein